MTLRTAVIRDLECIEGGGEGGRSRAGSISKAVTALAGGAVPLRA